MKKVITHDEALILRGLVKLAQEHARKAAELDALVHSRLDAEIGGHFSDVICWDWTWDEHHRSFEDAMVLSEIVVLELAEDESSKL